MLLRGRRVRQVDSGEADEDLACQWILFRVLLFLFVSLFFVYLVISLFLFVLLILQNCNDVHDITITSQSSASTVPRHVALQWPRFLLSGVQCKVVLTMVTFCFQDMTNASPPSCHNDGSHIFLVTTVTKIVRDGIKPEDFQNTLQASRMEG